MNAEIDVERVRQWARDTRHLDNKTAWADLGRWLAGCSKGRFQAVRVAAWKEREATPRRPEEKQQPRPPYTAAELEIIERTHRARQET